LLSSSEADRIAAADAMIAAMPRHNALDHSTIERFRQLVK
jgi:hypothetical protein